MPTNFISQKNRFNSMTMKLPLLALISGLLLTTSSINLVQAQPNLYQQALDKTKTENFDSAIQDFTQASEWFYDNKDYANAYKSSFLADYLNHQEIRRNAFLQGENPFLPSWYKMGRCLGDDCPYGVLWANPSPLGGRFGGVLILEKYLRLVYREENSGIPISAIFDVQIVPALAPGEIIMSDCLNLSQSQEMNSPIVALVQPRGDEDKEYFKNIRKAWKINLNTPTFEAVSPNNLENIACPNPCPNGC